VIFAVISVVLQVFIPYKIYSAVLKWLTLSLFAYVGTVFVTHVPWTEALRGTFLPTLLFDRESMAALIAVLATTISPYLFFWQSGEEVEQMDAIPKEKPLREGVSSRLGEADAKDRYRYLFWNGSISMASGTGAKAQGGETILRGTGSSNTDRANDQFHQDSIRSKHWFGRQSSTGLRRRQ
jgi:Mn2+/Fe2+ NRAMP family transporter